MAITPLPDPPSRANPADFAAKGDAFLGALPTFQAEANALALAVNSDAVLASDAKVDAETAAATANASANFVGEWSTLTGLLSVPSSVLHNDSYWMLLVNVADVTTTEPSVSGDWAKIGGAIDALSTDLDCNGKTFNGSSYQQIADASLGTGTHTFDYSQGDMQQLTVTGDITIDFSNFVAGKVCTMILDIVNGGDWTITYPAGMLFSGATAPTLTSGGTDRVLVIKDADDVYSFFVVGAGIGVVA